MDDETNIEEHALDLIVTGLVRDGVDTWICDLEMPELGWEAKGVYLFGKTEEEAYDYAKNNFTALLTPIEESEGAD